MEINKDGDHVFTEDDVAWTKEVIIFLVFRSDIKFSSQLLPILISIKLY